MAVGAALIGAGIVVARIDRGSVGSNSPDASAVSFADD